MAEYLFSPKSRIYVTESVAQRLSGLRIQIKKKLHMKYVDMYRILGMNCTSSMIKLYNNGEYTPTIERYIKLGTILGWNLSRDVSYRLYTDKLTKEELRYRWYRLRLPEEALSQRTGLSWRTLCKALRTGAPYAYDALKTTANIALSVRKYELELHLPNPLDLEE